MDQPAIMGIDLAKSVFQVHGVSADGPVVLRRQLRRGQVLNFFPRLDPCLIGMEARSGASLGAGALGARSRGAADAGGLREALRQARQDGSGGRRGRFAKR